MADWLSSAEGQRAVRTSQFALQPNNCHIDGQAPVGKSYPKSARLRKRADFVRLTCSPDKFATKGFLVVWLLNDVKQARLGVTVSKKVGCSVTRNRVKRYIREVFRNYRHCLLPADYNVIARRESASMDFSTVLRELEKVFKHIGVSPCSRASRSF